MSTTNRTPHKFKPCPTWWDGPCCDHGPRRCHVFGCERLEDAAVHKTTAKNEDPRLSLAEVLRRSR